MEHKSRAGWPGFFYFVVAKWGYASLYYEPVLLCVEFRMPENDGFYVQRCLDGHPDEYRHLVRRYQGPLMAHLTGLLGNRDIAEEAAQDVMVRCYFGLSGLKKQESFFAWMLGVANHVVKEQLRSRQRQEELAQGLAEKPVQTNPGSDWPLAKAIAKLDDSHRQLILLRYYGGHTCKEVAQMLNIPIGTVTKSLSRAYALLRETLKAEESGVRI
jgi:RNA polymerase sigma-70 factor (ECF subfamily)